MLTGYNEMPGKSDVGKEGMQSDAVGTPVFFEPVPSLTE